jgi:hypothetical protein
MDVQVVEDEPLVRETAVAALHAADSEEQDLPQGCPRVAAP